MKNFLMKANKVASIDAGSDSVLEVPAVSDDSNVFHDDNSLVGCLKLDQLT